MLLKSIFSRLADWIASDACAIVFQLCHVRYYLDYFTEHFTVVYSVTWPLNGSEDEGDTAFLRKYDILMLTKAFK